MTRRGLAIFVAAVVGVPVAELIFIGYELTDTPRGSALSVGLAAAAGVAAGANVFILLRALGPRIDPTTERATAIGSSLIVFAAVSGTFTSVLPSSVVVFVDGAVLGFFLAFDVFVVRLWRRDGAFRSRMKRAWRGE